jgi:hypothetical protein
MIEQAGLSIAISEGAGLRIADCPETFSPAVNLALIFIISFSTHFAGEMQGLRTVHISGGYCWSTPFKVLGVLFLGGVSSAFLPSKKACWTHIFRHVGVDQQYRVVFADTLQPIM